MVGDEEYYTDSEYDDIYSVYCPECEWIGTSDDCRYGKCPCCGERVRKEKV